jgi:amidohydrolase
MKELEPYYIELRRKLHANPETALEEFATTKLIKDEMSSYGIEVIDNGKYTGAVGILKGDLLGKTVALRADIDALPLLEQSGLEFSSNIKGKCHACGHDIHTTILLACARLLSERKNTLRGKVKFIFQPAEEGQKGAKIIIENGFIDDVDAIFAGHTWPETTAGSIGVRFGSMMAGSVCFNINIHVKGGHAAHPHKTPDSIAIAAYTILALQTIVSRELSPTDNAVITIGKMTAGTARNIIPPDVVLEGTFRYLTDEVKEKGKEAIKRIAIGTAKMFKAEADVAFDDKGTPVINDEKLVNIVAKAAQELLGKEQCVQLEKASMGSEDFAYYLTKVPGALFRFGTMGDGDNYKLALHNNKLLFSEKAIAAGAVTECGVVYLFTESGIENLKK